MASIDNIEKTLRKYGCGGGVVVVCLDNSGVQCICQEKILEALSDKIFELNGHSEDARKLSNYIDLFVASGAGVTLALPIARFHLDINDIKVKNATLAQMSSRHRLLSSKSLRALGQETWVEGMIKKSCPGRIPGRVPVIRHDGDIKSCQGAFVLDHTELQPKKTTTGTVWAACMARTYKLNDSEHHKDPKGNLRTLAPIDEYFPLLHLPQAAMAARGVIVGERRYKSHVSAYANPVMLGISEAVTLYNKRAGEGLQRTDLGGVAAVISIGTGIKEPTRLVHPLRRYFYRNTKMVDRAADLSRTHERAQADQTLAPTMHEQAKSMLENSGKPYRDYYRFDPPWTRFPDSTLSIPCKLYEWSKKTRTKLEALTESYLADPRTKMQLEELARFLIAIKRVRNSSTRNELYRQQPAVELDIQPVTQSTLELDAYTPSSPDFRASNRTQTLPHRSQTVIPRSEPTRESEDARIQKTRDSQQKSGPPHTEEQSIPSSPIHVLESASLSSNNLYLIIKDQIRQPSPISDYLDRIVKNQHGLISSQQPRVFGLLYQAFFDALARDSTASAEAHLAAAKIIAKGLKLDSEFEMNHPFGPEPCLYPVSMRSVPRTITPQLLKEIGIILKRNKHPGSFGSIFDVGISTNTRVTCCVFGSKSPGTFVVAKELCCGKASIPVLVIEDMIDNTTISKMPPTNWLKMIRHANNGMVDLSGYSVGLEGDVNEAGSFGFYGVHKEKIYGFTAAYCTPGAQQGSVIVSPSTRELTCRLQTAVRYTSFSPEGSKIGPSPGKQKEVEDLLGRWTQADSTPGCEIVERVGSGESQKIKNREIMLLGEPFGTVKAISSTYKLDVLEEHNQRLRGLNAELFTLPGEGDLGQGGRIRSLVEWCCFEVNRQGGNQYSSGIYQGHKIRGSQILSPNMPVFKYGRSTDGREGIVNECVVQKWMDDNLTVEIGVIGQAEEAFADRGDSGSLVITAREASDGSEGIYAVGLLIGKSNRGLALVTPLWAILEDVKGHGLEISLEEDT